ncbi:TetR/AcrR family transcriptional regulator [Lacticaseibacillus mingshuiensis]|uniref:TetR/AcrR family transcriptional regulator n=1 Tax=Lacticaseibacillus mingshuiensis TaxID=2799574 RepID=UPI00194E0BB1|nr:TetR/AcrR family transcriptional regulator [Lacticaseibacillus mingshuiensis]
MSKQVLSQTRIIECGIALINNGSAVSFANIARELGTKSQALYPYFTNQQALSYAILDQTVASLVERLKTDLFGKTGREALVEFALICRRVCLEHPRLSQFIVALPRSEDAIADEPVAAFRTLLTQSVAAVVASERARLLGGRLLRDLIIGELINISSGWFNNAELPQEDSFRWMIERGIDALTVEDRTPTK